MAPRTSRWPPILLFACFVTVSCAYGQVFVVGERSATSDISTAFTPTDVPLSKQPINERDRRDLVRMLESEQGFAHRALPMGPGLVLQANGPLTPGPAQYKRMIYEKGQAAGPGDRVIITMVTVKNDRIIFDFNGGPYAKHRFLSHIELNGAAPVSNPGDQAVGSRLTLVFDGGLPDISAPEVKALMQPVVDFGAKSSEQAYADTLPAPIKNAIEEHDVLVGMTHRMVMAAIGAPEQKVRDRPSDEPGAQYEEWIYGHVPQTVKFIRFVGDRVTRVEIAALGKPLEIHDKNEMGDYAPPVPTREIAMGDARTDGTTAAAPPPTLRQPNEKADDVPNAGGKVQYPAARIPPPPGSGDPSDPSGASSPSDLPVSSTPQNSPGMPNGMPNSRNPQNTPGIHPTLPPSASGPLL